MEQLRSKDKDIEKYIYLSGLKDADPNMFYELCLNHMPVSNVLRSSFVNLYNVVIRKSLRSFILLPSVMRVYNIHTSSGNPKGW
jgi:hypothetical protein